MPQRIKRALSATFALAVLAGLMIHSAVTSGCSSSSPVAAPETPADAATGDPSAAPEVPAAKEETFFPASKAGPMSPRKSHAPPANQNAAPQQK
ncbi:MAG: hypothetical protein WKG00_07035 [Polyangiaceae bacterium]